MVKRKLSREMETPLEKKKKVSISSSEEGKFDFTSPDKLMQSLLGDTKLSEFFQKYWEKKPFLIKRKDNDFYGSLFSLSTLKEVLQYNELNFETGINVCRYKDGEKELLNEEGVITAKDVDRLINEKQATFQFHHPQRYVDDLWNLVEKLETYFGNLVGSNAYITPADSQGLAPHCDDVEIFVLQLEGKKEWKLYKPQVELSRDYTQDLLQEMIGDPILNVSLEVGDLLYFPRGIIHQCKTVGDSHSTHLSISTYQQNTWGDFMPHAVTQAIEKALEDDVSFRSGLPINYLSIMGTGKNLSQYIEDETDKKSKSKHSNLNQGKVKDFKKTVQGHLSKLIDHIDVNTAVDAMCTDFMANRLPPYGYKSTDNIEKVIPKFSDKIKMRYPIHVRVVYIEDEDSDDEDSENEEMEEDEEKPAEVKDNKDSKSDQKSSNNPREDEDDDDSDAEAEVDNGPHIKIIHSLGNNRFAHMGPEQFDAPGHIQMDVSFAKTVADLLSCNDFVAIKDLIMDNEEDKLTLASTLLANDLVEMKSD